MNRLTCGVLSALLLLSQEILQGAGALSLNATSVETRNSIKGNYEPQPVKTIKAYQGFKHQEENRNVYALADLMCTPNGSAGIETG